MFFRRKRKRKHEHVMEYGGSMTDLVVGFRAYIWRCQCGYMRIDTKELEGYDGPPRGP